MNRLQVPKPSDTGDGHTHHWIPAYLGKEQYELRCVTCKLPYAEYLKATGEPEL